MKDLRIQAVAINAESVQIASRKGRDIWKEVRTCKWLAVVLSAERLTSNEADEVLQDETFWANLLLLGIDEAHVVVPWGEHFRQDYHQMGLIQKHLPEGVAFVAATATLAPGKEQDDLCGLLGLRKGHFHTIQLSCKHLNVRTVIRELTHGLSSYQFPDIAWIPSPGTKAVIYFAFGMGMDEKNIGIVVNLGLVKSLSAWLQQIGRGGRDPASKAQGITYVEATALEPLYTTKRKLEEEEEEEEEKRARKKHAKEEGEEGAQSDASAGAELEEDEKEFGKGQRGKVAGARVVTTLKQVNKEKTLATKKASGKGSAGKQGTKARGKVTVLKATAKTTKATGSLTMGENTARLLSAHVDNCCLNTEINDIFGNPGANAKENCHVAKRPLPCSTCLPFWSNPAPAPQPAGFMDPTPASNKPQNSGPTSLTKLEHNQVHAKLHEFAWNQWSLKTTAFA
ncbi:hypothetical protein JAAARDRAFT_192127 [Jaapia argillacea MUCL 33604]|uniref:DNA 3'-5' helicase n=1 Tax=Jaapia argillacea MUCL 33604 TaxID=933084 RepID=A0A067Q0D9_9AGAM|nr:hypothetical protein JAAARDRAFT_192127 [Jaapia argillacea MUCL 33604]